MSHLEVSGYVKINGVDYENPIIRISAEINTTGETRARANIYVQGEPEPKAYKSVVIPADLKSNLYNGCVGNAYDHVIDQLTMKVKIDLEAADPKATINIVS